MLWSPACRAHDGSPTGCDAYAHPNITGERCPKTLETTNRGSTLPLRSLAIVFAIDLLTPIRIAIWVFYMLPVVLCMWVNRPSVPLATAAVSAVLIMLGFAYSASDPNTSREVLQINRAMGILVLLVMAAVAHLYIKLRLAVQRTVWLQQGVAQLNLQLRGGHRPRRLA